MPTAPTAFSLGAAALDLRRTGTTEIVVVGDRPDLARRRARRVAAARRAGLGRALRLAAVGRPRRRRGLRLPALRLPPAGEDADDLRGQLDGE